jgi:hypothetical protein
MCEGDGLRDVRNITPTKAVLRETVELNSGIQLAAWYNNRDTVTVRSDHHTLSLYADGYESYQKRRTAGKTAAARIVFA